MKRIIGVVLSVLLSVSMLEAKIVLPKILSDNMVLQQKSTVKIWGKSNANGEVSVYSSWNNKITKTVSNSDGRWVLEVKTVKAGGPYLLKISDQDGEITIQNILLGEVWLCSGQSNMQMQITGLYNTDVENAQEVIRNANGSIRMAHIKQAMSLSPTDDCVVKWEEETAEKVAKSSAVAYFFGKYLQEKLQVPIGLIVSCWGSSLVEAWMDEETASSFKTINLDHLQGKRDNRYPPYVPVVLYNAMLAPILNYDIKGMIWYQGESNIPKPNLYRELMTSFVEKTIRKGFGSKDMPFYYAQIAPFTYDNYDGKGGVKSAKLREVQMWNMQDIPHSGMAVTMDIGALKNIHPPKKKEVGERLAYWALAKTYKQKIPFSGPIYRSMEVEEDEIILSFDHVGQGFKVKDGTVATMEIAGKDKIFYPAKVSVKGKKLVVSASKVMNPVAVRYGFKNFFQGDLYNKASLPASSFRTDDW